MSSIHREFYECVLRHYNKAVRSCNPYLEFRMLDSEEIADGMVHDEGGNFVADTPARGQDGVLKYAVVMVRITGLMGGHDEFRGGEYLVEIRLNNGLNGKEPFPFSPPEFVFRTPNFVYRINGKNCISIGEFHSSDYKPAMGFYNFCVELINGMICWNDLGGGIGLNSVSDSELKRMGLTKKSENYRDRVIAHYAGESREFNRKYYGKYIDLFEVKDEADVPVEVKK